MLVSLLPRNAVLNAKLSICIWRGLFCGGVEMDLCIGLLCTERIASTGEFYLQAGGKKSSHLETAFPC